MNEKNERKKLRNLALFSVCMTIFLFMAGYMVSRVFLTTFQEVTEGRMQEDIQNYSNRIENQVEDNFQMLRTLARFIEVSGTDEKHFFEEGLKKAEAENDFLLFGFFNAGGQGIVSFRGVSREIKLSEMQDEVRMLIRSCYDGKPHVSDAFIGQLSSQKVFAYGVPVYKDGEVAGALFVSDPVEGFSNELGDQKLNYGSGVMHIVDSHGNFLIRAADAIVQKELSTVLDEPYLSKEEAQAVRQKLKEQDTVEFTFLYENKEYNTLLKPLHINDWYLCCINSMENVNKDLYDIVSVATNFFVIVVTLFFCVLYLGYKEMQKSAKRLREIAYYDSLTGLYNIQQFMELCEETAETKEQYSIVVINIRQFKFVNEIFGKSEADRLLCDIAKVLEESLHPEEYACRESADYFYLFLLDTDEEILKSRLRKMNDQIVCSEVVCQSNYQLKLWCGVDVAEKGNNIQKTMTHALFAVAKLKQVPHEFCAFFDAQLHEQEQLDNYIENHAHEALEKKQFSLFLQPKVQVENRKVIGAEALVRWIKEDGTLMPPGLFIPLFEANGFCVNLDKYMVEEVCIQICKWREAGLPVVPVSVNQSRLTFYRDHYVEELCEILDKYNVPPSLITLEILEGLILDDTESLNHCLERLRRRGFRISMDDFGTGYSSLNSLGKLSIDEIKLDRGFLREASENKGKIKLIMGQIVQFSKQLSIATVIEGVETEEDHSLIKRIGCDVAQGYFYGRPVQADVFTREFLEESN